MRKKYFAKYLPVPGEIGSGDMFQFPGMSIKECLGTDDGLVWYESAYPDVSESASCDPGDCQRMVMHLMGAVGIQAGDKVLDRYGYPDKRSPKEEKWWTVGVMDIGNPCNLKECYKVIGLISPEATWVKEGDEFEEEETVFYLLSTDLKEQEMSYKQIQAFVGRSHKNVGIKLKGPCGHFH